MNAPVMIEFAPGSWILNVEATEASVIGAEFEFSPAITNSTFVVLPSGEKIEIPSDQIVHSDEAAGLVRIGLGGMSFEGVRREGRDAEKLVFWRVKELLPEELLPVGRDPMIAMGPEAVSKIVVQGTQVWPRA
jgi:hypothetical protein